EVVFHHRPSRTLICSDLLFNITHPATAMTSVALTLMGTKGRFAASRAWWLFRRDRTALKMSLDHLLTWDFARVVPAHGDVVEARDGASDVRELTRSALQMIF